MFGRRRRKIAEWVNILLDGEFLAQMALESYGKDAWRALLAAIIDPRSVIGERPPIIRICEILWRGVPDALTESLISNWPRIPDAALVDVVRTLCLIGSDRSIGFVRATYEASPDARRALILRGIMQRLHQKWRSLPGTLTQLYDLVLPTLAGKRDFDFGSVALAMLLSDPQRATAYLTQNSLFHIDSDKLKPTLRAFHDARVRVPEDCMVPIVSELDRRMKAAPGAEGSASLSMFALPVFARSSPLKARLVVSAWCDSGRGNCSGIAEAVAVLNDVEDAYWVVMRRVLRTTASGEIIDQYGDMSVPQQNYYVAYKVDEQVCNGGFRQFFWNPSGRCSMHAPRALRAIGASGKAELAQEALEAVGMERFAQAPDGRPEIDDEPTLKKLSELDTRYYEDDRKERHEDVLDLLKHYAAKNAEHFRLNGANS